MNTDTNTDTTMFFWRKFESDFNADELRAMADAVRALSLDQVQAAQSGHPGAPLGMADVITTVFANHLRFNPTMPDWADRDRFVLSMGHASAMLYATLHLAGYDVSMDDLRNFRQLGAKTQGHPEYGSLPGIETSTGPLGQGIANSVGMALAAKIQSSRLETRNSTSESRISNLGSRIYCLCSDGDLMEGISQEAISFAGYYKLNNLIVMWDNNGISIDGSVATVEDMSTRFLAAGWAVIEIDGMNPAEIDRSLRIAKNMKKPVLIACKTTIGYLSEHAGTAAVHGNPLSDADAATILEKIRPGGAPFTVLSDAAGLWAKLQNIKIDTITITEDTSGRDIVQSATDIKILMNMTPSIKPESTRRIFGRAIKIAMEQMPEMLIGGSADLTESTHSRPDIAVDITPASAAGNYIHYGVREHAMAAIMNGLSLSGLRPYGSTFLIFSDYMRPAIRLSAIMKQPVIYVFTHDSVALGEDGITHQPIEQLASLRLIPNLHVMRPCNTTEVAVCMELALRRTDGPTALVLSRQDFEMFDPNAAPDDIEKGGYLIADSHINEKQEVWETVDLGYRGLLRNVTKRAGITLIASGGEIPLAIAVRQKLWNKFQVRVVSMPCLERFRLQSDEYKRTILTDDYKIAIEAGRACAWYEFADDVIGIDTFGKGGKGADVYRHLGFDANAIAEKIIKKLKI